MRSTEKQFFIFVSDENPQMLSVVPVPRPQSFQKPSGRLSLGSMEGITASAAASMDQGMHCTVPPQCATTMCHHPVPPPRATTRCHHPMPPPLSCQQQPRTRCCRGAGAHGAAPSVPGVIYAVRPAAESIKVTFLCRQTTGSSGFGPAEKKTKATP